MKKLLAVLMCAVLVPCALSAKGISSDKLKLTKNLQKAVAATEQQQVAPSYNNPTVFTQIDGLLDSLDAMRASLDEEGVRLWDEAVAEVWHLRERVQDMQTDGKTGVEAKKYIANFILQDALTTHHALITQYNNLYAHSKKAAQELNKLISVPVMNNGQKYLLVDLVHQGLLCTLFSTKVIHGKKWIGFALPHVDVATVLQWCQKADPAFVVDYNWGTLA